MKLLIAIFFTFAASLSIAQKVPAEGIKRDAWVYEKTFDTEIIQCYNIGYWLANAQEEKRALNGADKAKLSECIENGKESARNKFKNFRDKLSTDAEKSALKDHYVAWLNYFNDLEISVTDNLRTYKNRHDKNAQKMRETWTKFQVELE